MCSFLASYALASHLCVLAGGGRVDGGLTTMADCLGTMATPDQEVYNKKGP